MHTITVANMRSGSHDTDAPGVEYVGRPSALGNPYHLPPKASAAKRREVVANYEARLRAMLHQPMSDEARAFDRLLAVARERDLTLLCWCHPLPCHADVIAALLRERLAAEQPAEREIKDDAGDGAAGRG